MTFSKIRVRYAPSPTGEPHLGNIRTALFDWLIARNGRGEFVVRVEDLGFNPPAINDRTFTIEIVGADAPIFSTSAGQLDLSDSSTTQTKTKWVVDGTEVNYQILATDTDTATGQTLEYDIIEGSLPTGLTMSETGYISGIVQLAEDEKFGPRGGYSHYGFASAPTGWDPTVNTKSKSVNYEFKIPEISSHTSATASLMATTSH